MFEDKLLLKLRIERLRNPHAYSQAQPSWCQHVLEAPGIEDRGTATGVAVMRTPFLYLESRGDQQPGLCGGRMALSESRERAARDRDEESGARSIATPHCRRCSSSRDAILAHLPAQRRMNRVLLTGASSGIGLATAQAFLGRGLRGGEPGAATRVRSPRRGSARSRSISPMPRRRAAVALELAAEAPATTIVHCAGAIREKPLEDTDIADFTALANLHVGAAISLVQANLPAMKQAHYGRIVLIASRAVLGLAKRTAYAATKAGMLGLVRTWALELAPHGVTANAVAPGPIAQTEMFDSLIPPDSPKMAAALRQIPAGRFGTPADVARAVMFLADPKSSFITGQTLFVCGGTSIGSIVY